MEMNAASTGSTSLRSSGEPSRSLANRNSDVEKDTVPETLTEAISVFLRQPTVLGVLMHSVMPCGEYPAHTASLVGISMATFWILQEWFLHKYLLHCRTDWFGRKIHIQHHQRPYYHVCVDGPVLVLGVMIVSALILKTVFLNAPIGDTAVLTYWFMGLMYIWCHFLVHTRYVPRNKLMKAIRRNHMRHHLRDSRYCFSFVCPWIDTAFKTTPP